MLPLHESQIKLEVTQVSHLFPSQGTQSQVDTSELVKLSKNPSRHLQESAGLRFEPLH
jgi:hypothetical protein